MNLEELLFDFRYILGFDTRLSEEIHGFSWRTLFNGKFEGSRYRKKDIIVLKVFKVNDVYNLDISVEDFNKKVIESENYKFENLEKLIEFTNNKFNYKEGVNEEIN